MTVSNGDRPSPVSRPAGRPASRPASRPVSRRSTLLAALLGAGTLGVSACGAGGSGAQGGSGGGGQSLTVLVEGGGKAQLEPVAAQFTEETGTAVTFVELPYTGLYDRVSTEAVSGRVSYDVAALDAIWLPAFAGSMRPLDALFTDAVTADLFPALLTEAKVDGSFVGMPVWTNAEVLLYRTDLFEDPAEQAAFAAEHGYPLAPPATWEQYDDVARFFTRDTDGDGAVDLYGADVKGAVETEWLATVLQAGAPSVVLAADGSVVVADAAHKAALDHYTALVALAPSGAAQLDWAAAQNLFNQGTLAMTRFWAHAFTQVPADSPVSGKVGVAPMPAGPGGLAAVPGAWYLGVPAATAKADLAEQFVAYAFANNALSLDSALGLAASRSALEGAAGRPGHENLGPLVETLQAPGTQPRPATAKWQQIVDTVLVPMIQKAVADPSQNQRLLDDAKTQIEAVLG